MSATHSLLRSLILLLAIAMVATARSLTPQDVVSLPRPGAPAPAPNGLHAVYAQSVYHPAEDKTTRNLYLVDIEQGKTTPLTEPSFDTSQNDPFFLDDTHVAYFETAGEGVTQLHVRDIQNQTEPYRLTDFPVEFANVKYNAQKRLLAFSAQVYQQDGSLVYAKKRDAEIKETKRDTALVYDELMVRHWDSFVPEKKNNIFVVELELVDGKYKVAGEPRNLLARTGLESPIFPDGGASDYDISPNGDEIAFLAKIKGSATAWETSKFVYVVPTSGQSEPVVLNNDIPAAATSPTYAPSGALAYLQMMEPQYESDRNRIVLHKNGERVTIAEDWDRSPSSLAFSPDESVLYVTAEEHGRNKLFAIDLHKPSLSTILTLTETKAVSSVSVLPSNTLLFTASSMQSPNVIYTLDSTGKRRQIGPSADLAERLGEIQFSTPEEFLFEGALGDSVHGWLIKPADFDPSKKYPLAFLIHGGPQGAWSDSWSTRWNPQVFAGAGFVVVAINPHGSTGYGQKFTDSIKHNWGSHPYHDLEKGVDYILSKYDFIDPDRLTALGASYGGYMINWLNGHTNRFKAFVNHDGMFSTINTYYTTEELYFPEREFGGPPYHALSRVVYERWSPSNYVQNWKTPTLVIHGKRKR
ncbi:Alpha/Beta hydrolase protein [Syncephalastrum racemosum]|uniref:Dipeptidyl-peptidase V n=1 Tax=Syncephalastrum racemosum TaxID=13706 RepID=A0A1X2HHT3_SYNRA|nr:Alpha/Beta hydrolase protein [Syncephalastrum racemosum]